VTRSPVDAFEGVSADEIRPLIDFLVRHTTQPRLIYRHHWQNGDMLMWDNRRTMHSVLADYDRSQLRHLGERRLSARHADTSRMPKMP
jgi:taurine dioxygenase